MNPFAKLTEENEKLKQRVEALEEELRWAKREGAPDCDEELITLCETFGLTDSQGRVLLALYRAKGRTLSRAALLDALPAIWGDRQDRLTTIVDVHASRIRGKLKRRDCIESIWGKGYRLTDAHTIARIEAALSSRKAAA